MEILKAGKNVKVSQGWKNQYFDGLFWGSTYGPQARRSAKTVYEQIVAIEDSRSRNKLDKIDQLIGNKSWTHAYCSGCSTPTRENLVSIDVSGGEYSCQLCITCVKKMLTLLENAK